MNDDETNKKLLGASDNAPEPCYALWYARRGGIYYTEHDRLEDAIQDAVAVMKGDGAWPVKISEGLNKTLWEQSGPMETANSLEVYAAAHSIKFD